MLQTKFLAKLISIVGLAALLGACQPSASDHHRAEDIAAIQQMALAIDRTLDAKRWEDIPRYFAKEVIFDVGSLTNEPTAAMSRQDLTARWEKKFGTGFGATDKTSFHQRGTGIVTVKGNKATLVSNGYVWNKMVGNGPPLWEVWGTYTYNLKRRGRPKPGDSTNGMNNRKRTPWVVTGIRLDVAHERGNVWVRDTLAADRELSLAKIAQSRLALEDDKNASPGIEE